MEEMTHDEIVHFVKHAWLAHVGLAQGSRAYVIPVFYGYHDGNFYFHSHHGTKDTFIDSTEEACLTVTRAETEQSWASVMAFGPVQRVTFAEELKQAMDSLLRAPLPPEWGFSETGEPKRSGEDLEFWKLHASRMTGRKSVPPLLD